MTLHQNVSDFNTKPSFYTFMDSAISSLHSTSFRCLFSPHSRRKQGVYGKEGRLEGVELVKEMTGRVGLHPCSAMAHKLR